MQRLPYTRREEIEDFLSARSVRGTLRVQDNEIDLTIHSPDLRDCAFSMWGDWGPMYTFQLNESASVRFEYHCAEKDLHAQYVLPQRTLSLHSPALAVERYEFPFYLKLVDPSRAVQARAYLNHEGEFARLSTHHHLSHGALEHLFGPFGREYQHDAERNFLRTA